jgi:hypothetical protein
MAVAGFSSLSVIGILDRIAGRSGDGRDANSTVARKEGSSNKENGRIETFMTALFLPSLLKTRLAHGCVVMALGLSLCGCVTAGHDESASAPLKPLAKMAGFATDPPEAADFVKASRPTADLTYMPVGVTPSGPKMDAKRLTPDELKALQDDLDAARAKNAAASGINP